MYIFFDDSLDNIRDVRLNTSNVIAEQFLPSSNSEQVTRDLITKINSIKDKHCLPKIYLPSAVVPTTDSKKIKTLINIYKI